MYTEGAPVLHVVDDATYFNVAQKFPPLTTESGCETILSLWPTVYSGLLKKLVFHDGSQFRDTFVEICKTNDIEWQRSGTKHHSALFKGEIYYERIRRKFPDFRSIILN